MRKTVLVTGSRNWKGVVPIRRELTKLLEEHGSLMIVQGGAKGADAIAFQITKELGQTPWTFPADWAKEGRSAGPQRNQRMLEKATPDLVLAFSKDLSASKGTADMVRRAQQAGVEVRVFTR